MSKNLAKAISGACGAKSISEGADFATPWVIYNPDSTNFKVLYSVHGDLNGQNEYYGDEFANCGDVPPTPTEKALVCKYSASTSGEEFSLFHLESGSGSGSGSGGGSGSKYPFTSMEVDGVEVAVTPTHTFDTAGEHTVKFTLADPTSIGDGTFYDCTRLKSIIIPDSVTHIGENAFKESGLPSIDIPDSVTSIGYGAFYNCYSLTSCTIGNGVTSIGNETFQGCNNLTSIDIPDSVTSIDYSAFYECNSLTSCTIGSGVTSIGSEAFKYCSGLTNIDIPDGVTSIGDSAFGYCTGLTSVTVNAVTPPTLGVVVFDDINCSIYVPANSVEDYKAATNWSNYADMIQEIPSSGSGSGSGSRNG